MRLYIGNMGFWCGFVTLGASLTVSFRDVLVPRFLSIGSRGIIIRVYRRKQVMARAYSSPTGN